MAATPYGSSTVSNQPYIHIKKHPKLSDLQKCTLFKKNKYAMEKFYVVVESFHALREVPLPGCCPGAHDLSERSRHPSPRSSETPGGQEQTRIMILTGQFAWQVNYTIHANQLEWRTTCNGQARKDLAFYVNVCIYWL